MMKVIVPSWIEMSPSASARQITVARPAAPPPVPSAGAMQPIHPKV